MYHKNIKFYTQYTHPTLICRGTDARTDGRTENIYSIFRDKLLLLGEHVYLQQTNVIHEWGNDMQVKCRWCPTGREIVYIINRRPWKFDKHNFDTMDSNTKDFLKAVKTSCQSVGHSEEATKNARRKCFAMLDFFGLNSLFLSTTPDDDCSFRVRLYTKPQNLVSVQNPSKYLDPKYFDNPFTRTKTQYSRNSNILSICFVLISFCTN